MVKPLQIIVFGQNYRDTLYYIHEAIMSVLDMVLPPYSWGIYFISFYPQCDNKK